MAVRKGKDVTENPLYHDTWKLLQKYRDVVWSMELSTQQLKTAFIVFLFLALRAWVTLGLPP